MNLETEEQLMESKLGKISLPLSRYENTLLLLNTLIYLRDMQRSDHDLRSVIKINDFETGLSLKLYR